MVRNLTEVPMAVLELPATLQFICSCALSRALAESVRIEWKTYDGSRVLNAIYTLLPWKERPGYADFHMSTRKEVEGRYVQIAQMMTASWLGTIPKGPRAMHEYLEKLKGMRERDRANIEAAARDAREVNRQVVDDINTTIRVLQGIKLASTVAVVGMSAGVALGFGFGGITLGASAGTFGAVNTGYSITCSVIKTWNDVPSAKVVGIGTEVGKAVAGEASDRYGASLISKAAEQIGLQETLIGECRRKIDMYGRVNNNTISQRLAGHARAKSYVQQANLSQAQQGLQSAQQQQLQKTAAAGALKTVTVVFFAAWDILAEASDFRDTWNDTR
jgi:hypothetical protein